MSRWELVCCWVGLAFCWGGLGSLNLNGDFWRGLQALRVSELGPACLSPLFRCGKFSAFGPANSLASPGWQIEHRKSSDICFSQLGIISRHCEKVTSCADHGSRPDFPDLGYLDDCDLFDGFSRMPLQLMMWPARSRVQLSTVPFCARVCPR